MTTTNPIAVTGLSPREILGLAPSASAEEIRGAFRLLAKAVHPDVLPRGKGLFQVIQAAQDAALGSGWPSSDPWSGIGYSRGFGPVPPRPPRPDKPKAPTSVWRRSRKGNWTRKVGDGWATGYFKNDAWRWVVPNPDGMGDSIFSEDGFESPGEAMEDAEQNLGVA